MKFLYRESGIVHVEKTRNENWQIKTGFYITYTHSPDGFEEVGINGEPVGPESARPELRLLPSFRPP